MAKAKKKTKKKASGRKTHKKTKGRKKLIRRIKRIKVNQNSRIKLFLIWVVKMGVSIGFDLIDFFMPPGIGSIYDFGGGIIGFVIWGPKGTFQLLELIDITDRIDAFSPTLTIMGLFGLIKVFKGEKDGIVEMFRRIAAWKGNSKKKKKNK